MALRSSAPSARPAAVERKPMASARRVSLFEREIRVRLSSSALEILFDIAAVLSEGGVDGDGYFGSTMITIDLARAGALVSEECDASTARRVCELLSSDRRVAERARRIALDEARARAARPLLRPQVDMSVRATGAHLQIDLDVEASVAE